MIDALRALIETIIQIRTPLMFWAFFLAVLAFCFFTFLNRKKTGNEFTLVVANRLKTHDLYSFVRLVSILAFLFLFSVAVLAFASPLIDTYLRTLAGETEDQIELRKKYNDIIAYYKSGEIAKAQDLIMEAFHLEGNLTSDELTGYIAATYSGLSDYKSAAIEVIRRDSNRKKWDYSLLYDMGYCIRLYAIKHSGIAGMKLVDELEEKYHSKLLSHLWVFTPLSVLKHIKDSEYEYISTPDLDQEFIANINTVVSAYPNDKFLDYAHYLLGEYEIGLAQYPGSRIKDLYLYAAGYEKMRPQFSGRGYNVLLPDSELTDRSENSLLQAKRYFEEYIRAYKRQPHADDAAYWLAWIELSLHNKDNGFSWLDKVYTLGNSDYTYHASSLLESVLKTLTPYEGVSLLHRYNFLNHPTYDKYVWWCTIIDKSSFTEAMDIINSVDEDYKSGLFSRVAQKQLDSLAFSESRVAALESIKYHSGDYEDNNTKELLQKLNLIESCEDDGDRFVNAAIKLRRKYGDRHLSNYALAESSRLNTGYQADYIDYLRVINYREWKTEKMPELAQSFLINHPNSPYADDIMAELSYLYLYVYDNSSLGIKAVQETLNRYPKGNACDNALHWLASYYYDNSYYGSNRTDCIAVCNKIIQKYPLTRHAYAATAMKYELTQNARR